MSPNIRLNARTYLGQEKFVAKYPTITGFYQKLFTPTGDIGIAIALVGRFKE